MDAPMHFSPWLSSLSAVALAGLLLIGMSGGAEDVPPEAVSVEWTHHGPVSPIDGPILFPSIRPCDGTVCAVYVPTGEFFDTSDVHFIVRRDTGWSTPRNLSGNARAGVASRLPVLHVEPRAEGPDDVEVYWGEWRSEYPRDRVNPLFPTELVYAYRSDSTWTQPEVVVRSRRIPLQIANHPPFHWGGHVHLFHSVALGEDREKNAYQLTRNTKQGEWEVSLVQEDAVESHAAIFPAEGTAPERLAVTFQTAADPVETRRGRRDISSVFVVRSEDGGATWSAPILVDRSGLRAASKPRVFFGPTGHLHIFWMKYGPNETRNAILHSTSTSGDTWSRPDTLRADVPSNIAQLQVLADSLGGFHLTYQFFRGKDVLDAEYIPFVPGTPVTPVSLFRSWGYLKRFRHPSMYLQGDSVHFAVLGTPPDSDVFSFLTAALPLSGRRQP